MKLKFNSLQQKLYEAKLALENAQADLARTKAEKTEHIREYGEEIKFEKEKRDREILCLKQEIEHLKKEKSAEVARHKETLNKLRESSKKARVEEGEKRGLQARLDKSEFRNSEQQKEIQYLHIETTFPPRIPNSGQPEDVDEAVTAERFRRLNPQENGAV